MHSVQNKVIHLHGSHLLSLQYILMYMYKVAVKEALIQLLLMCQLQLAAGIDMDKIPVP